MVKAKEGKPAKKATKRTKRAAPVPTKPVRPRRKKPEPEPASRRLMSIRQYCAHRKQLGLPGHSIYAIQVAIKDGRIARTCPEHKRCPPTCGKGKINPDAADIEWAAMTDPDRVTQRGKSAGGRSMAEERAEYVYWQTRRAEIQYREAAGELVRKDQVFALFFRAARETRDAILMVPRRLSARLAAMEDRAEVEICLTEELRKAVAAITDDAIRKRNKSWK